MRPAPASRAPLRKSRREIGSCMPRRSWRCAGLRMMQSTTGLTRLRYLTTVKQCGLTRLPRCGGSTVSSPSGSGRSTITSSAAAGPSARRACCTRSGRGAPICARCASGSPAARWCVAQYFAELDRRFPGGFDPAASLPADDRDLVPPRGAFLVASIDGESVAGGCVKTTAPHVGSLKRMWVAAAARGLGIGRRMLTALEEQARALGITRLRLETNRTLPEAIALYRSAGYRAVAPFNADPYATHWFQKRLGRRLTA